MVSSRKRREKNKKYRNNRSEASKSASLVRDQKYSKNYYVNNRLKKIFASRLCYARNCSLIKAKGRLKFALNKKNGVRNYCKLNVLDKKRAVQNCHKKMLKIY